MPISARWTQRAIALPTRAARRLARTPAKRRVRQPRPLSPSMRVMTEWRARAKADAAAEPKQQRMVEYSRQPQENTEAREKFSRAYHFQRLLCDEPFVLLL